MCPTYHPSFVQREERNPACELIFEQDLDKALGMLDVTFPKYPAIEDGIRIIQDDREAINYLKKLLNNPPELAAFDYEASGLKPHLPKHHIVCCSIATDSNSATSFLMNNDIVRSLFIRFLTSKRIGKIGANIKFEHNWSREKFGVEVSNWIHDVCLAQHIADNRSNICSLKFITYVYRGISDYASHITPYLETKSKSGNAFNKIDSAPLNELQLYNGIDSKETFSIGIEQMENMI